MITLTPKLVKNTYLRSSIQINANVANATNGATVNEIRATATARKHSELHAHIAADHHRRDVHGGQSSLPDLGER